jgi:sugar-phosphatase
MAVSALDGRTFAAVLFDMDGTLIDSIGAVERSWATWAGEFDIDLERLLGFHGIPASGVIASLRPDLDADGQALAVRRIEELEVADTEGILVLPGAGEAGPGPPS